MEGNMSDFGSEDEDAEFALYAQLYFEPNDINVADTPKRNLCEISKCPQIGVTEEPKKDFCDKDYEITYDQVSEDRHKIKNNGNHLESVTGTLKRKLNIKSNGSKCHQVSEVQYKIQNGLETKSKDLNFEEKPVASDQFNTSQQSMICKSDGLVGLSNLPIRRRNSSICSVDSISGKVPLDNLYCNIFDSLEEEDELEGELSQSKTVKVLKKTKVVTGKRKKTSSLSDSSDEEDSRCRILKTLNTSEKGKFGKDVKGLEKMSIKRKGLDKRSIKKRKAREVVTIDSDTSENCRILPACQEGSQVVNEQDEILLPGTQELDKEKRYLQSARVVVISTAEDHSVNSVSVLKSSSSSSSDSDCVMYMKESPNLVMNFGKESNPKLKQKVTGKESNPKLKQKVTGKESNPKLKQKVTGKESNPKLKQKVTGKESNPKLKQKITFKESNSKLKQKKVTDQSRQLRTFDYTKRRPATKKTPSCPKFTPEMASFYDSDESDYFDIEDIHNQQSGLTSDWKIISSDLYVTPKKRYYNQEPRCKRCKQWGHTISECSRVQHCHICSGTDHVRREQCPSNCCFRCGGRFHGFCSSTSSKVVCALCGNRGHTERACPDLWRRYHSTISGSEPVPPEPGAYVYKTRKKYCCYCGRKGHYGFECRCARCSYIIQGQSVISYSTPVVEADGQLVVNLEGALVYENFTKVEIGRADVHKISGRRDSMINNISRVTGADLCAYEDNGRSYIQVIGDSGAQTSSYSVLETILGYSLWNPQLSPFMKTMSRNRNKEEIVGLVRKKINFYNGLSRRLPELPEAVRVLRKGLRKNGSASSTSRFSQRFKESLQLASLIVIGHLKWGEGQNIFQHVTQVLGQIKKLGVKEKVPLPILEDIACKLQKIDSPHIGQLDVILKLAEKYLENRQREKALHASKIQRPINNILDDDVIVLCENGSVENSKVDIEDQREKLINEYESSSNSVGGFGNEKLVILSRRIEQTEDVKLVHETGNEKLMSSSAKNSLPKAGIIRCSTSGLVDLPSLGDKCQEMNNCGQMKRSCGANAKLENEMPAVVKYEKFRSGRNKRVLADETEKLTMDVGTGSLKDENNGLEGVSYFVHKRPKSSDLKGNDSLGFSLSSALCALSEIRSRESVLEILQRTVVYCHSMQSKLPQLQDAVNVLKERQKFNSMTKSSPRGFQKKLKTALKLVSLLMLGHPKDGEVYHKISELLSQVWLLNSEAHVPEFIIKDIKNSLRKISNPSVKKLDYIVALADKYGTSESYVGEVSTRMKKCMRADQDHVGSSSSIMKTLDGEKDDKRITFDIVMDDARVMIEKQLLMSTKKRLKCSSEKGGANVNKMKNIDIERAVLEESFNLGIMKKLLPVKRKKGNTSIKNSGKQKYIRKCNPKEGTVLEKEDFPGCGEKVSSIKGKQSKAKNTINQTPFTSQRFTGLRQSNEVQKLSTLANSLKPKHKKVKNFSVTGKWQASKDMEDNSVKVVCGKQFNKKLKVRETDVDSSGLKYPKAKKKRKVISGKLKPKSALF